MNILRNNFFMLRKKESNTGLKTIWKVLRVKAVLFSTAKKERSIFKKKKKHEVEELVAVTTGNKYQKEVKSVNHYIQIL